MKSVVIIVLVLLGCVAFNEALQCYSHDFCTANCPQLADKIVTCNSDEDRCYKTALPMGVSRGCGKDRCVAQINAHGAMANLCCDNDLCNSASAPTITFGAIVMIIGAFMLVRM